MIKVSRKKHQVAVAKAYDAGQDHIFRFWEELDDAGRKELLGEIAEVDFQLLGELSEDFVLGKEKSRLLKNFKPPVTISAPVTDGEKATRAKAIAAGEEAILEGRVAAVMVAGGQSTRLEYDGPKGTYPIAPVTGKSLFQVHAEKILAIRRKYKTDLPLYVMTSEHTDEATREFFQAGKYFDLYKNSVSFFAQGNMPAVDRRGKLIMEAKSSIFLSPNGHGGVIDALSKHGMLDEMKKKGIEYIFYFQVDNPLVKIADPAFIGHHVLSGAQMSVKSVKRSGPDELMGVIGYLDGTLAIAEYSDLTEEEMHSTGPDGELVFGHGNPAIHIFSRDFLESIASGDFELPYHKAEKVIPFIDKNGEMVVPEKPNGVKFETFVFDALSYAKRVVVFEAEREEEFSPVKNATGTDTPDDARVAMTNLFGTWLEKAGVNIPRGEDGLVKGKVEISPLFAIDAEELAGKVGLDLTFSGSLLLS